jgi:outer membrane lipoprotein SlyB
MRGALLRRWLSWTTDSGVIMNAPTSRTALAVALTAGIALAGCANGPNRPVDEGYGQRDSHCQSCGVVQDVRQVDPGGGSSGVVIGAAVAAGAPGGQGGSQPADSGAAWRIVVRLDNGQYVSVVQRKGPGIRNGDYVELRDGLVYAR